MFRRISPKESQELCQVPVQRLFRIMLQGILKEFFFQEFLPEISRSSSTHFFKRICSDFFRNLFRDSIYNFFSNFMCNFFINLKKNLEKSVMEFQESNFKMDPCKNVCKKTLKYFCGDS